jgi:hypothetical protein
MSTPSVPYPVFNPYSLDPAQILAAMQNNSLTTNIYDSSIRTNDSVNECQRLLTSEISAVNKNIFDTIAQNAVSIERTSADGRSTTERINAQLGSAIERTSADGRATTQKANSDLLIAVERNGANGMSTTERVNSQLATAIERNSANGTNTTERTAGQVSSAVERNGGNITTAIERVAGEGRLTTTITDAASRQASNDSARDILRAVDRIGSDTMGSVKDTYSGLLGSIERNAGENRAATLATSGQVSQTLTDVRHSILNDVNRSASDVLLANTQNLNVLTKHVTDGAWEQRSAMTSGFQNLTEENMRGKAELAQQASTYYASNLLEQQKSSALVINKQDNHFAALLLEQQKVKECLAQQASQNFAINQLEQQKIRESLSLQLQEAKYEALKNKCDLSKEMAECCCEIKQKVDQRTADVIGTVDTLDRNRLRDEVNTTNNENNMLKFAEFSQWNNGGFGGPGGYGYGYGREGRDGRRDGRRN